jgi:predicted nucleic-acid-binding protein
MIALDTNVIVRLLVDDDAEQTRRARAALADDRGWIGLTVLVEVDLVLRRPYRRSRQDVAQALESLLDAEAFEIEAEESVRSAVTLVRAGLDFADALHLMRGMPHGPLATFDRQLVERANRELGPEAARAI